ncbi:tyrosine-type recombinase/integrase [Pseudoclavibacter helvolus]|uniref:tyrosine-type recombinase/integrase n=1 Tax=Pseudoclavibacter helvolus TaxID=255205 RepID=UPI0008385611|nr:site-specific integrase [Pseudoclavibacter helvolus]
MPADSNAAIGAHGAIRIDRITHGDGERIRARTRVRTQDGRYVQIERLGTSEAGATAAVKKAALERSVAVTGSDEFSPSMTLNALAAAFIADCIAARRSSGTIRQYKSVVDTHLKPRGALTLGELTTGRLQRIVDSIDGEGSRANVRRVLSSALSLAVRNDALVKNPMEGVRRETSGVNSDRTHVPPESVDKFLADIYANEHLLRNDAAEPSELMILMGLRVGELCALQWSDIDFDAGTLQIEATAVREKGIGMLRQPAPKTDASRRTLAIPARAKTLLLARFERMGNPTPGESVFLSVRGTVRDPQTITKAVGAAGAALGFPRITSHSFRRTTATLLHAAGLSPKDIADFLGHKNPAMTEAAYIQRQQGAARAAAAIDRVVPAS